MDYEQAIEALATSGIDIEKVCADLVTRRSERCAFCDGFAEFYCDHAYCWSVWATEESPGKEDRRVMSMKGEPATCDAPICRTCRKQIGIFFLPGAAETRDVCPIHAIDDGICLGDKGEMSAAQVEGMRLKDWKILFLQRLRNLDDEKT